MAPIIEFADWIAMQESIQAGAQAVSGMTVAEAQAALKATATATQSSNLYIYGSQAVQAAKPPLQFPASSAAQAAGGYVSGGGLTTSVGAATSNAASSQISNMALTQTAGGGTGVAGLLSVNLPTAAAAIAPLAGFALGVGLYELNPEFWEKISRALLPFCYEDTELLPVLVDEQGRTYYQKKAIDALKKVFADSPVNNYAGGSDIPGVDFSTILDPYPFPFGITDVIEVVNPYETLHVKTDRKVRACLIGGGSFIFADESSFNYQPWYSVSWSKANSATYNGKSFYYTGILTAGSDEVISSTPPNIKLIGNFNNRMITQVCYTMLYGDITEESEVGTSKWNGEVYPPTPEELAVISFIEGNQVFTESFYPIATPIGEPGVSVDPEATLDITVNTNPSPAINPWITTNPNPSTYPEKVMPSNPAQLPANVPDYSPNLDPNADPSQEPSLEPLPDPEPAESQKDEGESPTPSIPIIPNPSAAAGLLHIYSPTREQIDEFGRWLWTTFSGDLIDTLSKLFNDPMDAVIGLHEIYANPSISGTATIRAGYLDSQISSNLVGNRYTTINCGSIVIPEYYENYLDYSPYTKCFIYLPFVGIVPLTADDIVGNAVNVTYNIDVYNGCCIAIVTVAREGYSSTVYQFEGNCAVEIPITSGYQSVLMGGLLGMAGTAISGSPHVGLGLASLGRANLGKNEVSRSGSFGSSYGAMGAKIPYIIVKRPTQKSVVNYNQEYGFPAHKRVKIGACEGYLRVREVHVISPTATDAEKALIERMLKEGVFVK